MTVRGFARLCSAVMLSTGLFACGALAQNPDAGLAFDRVTLGWGSIYTNDSIGQGKDRWRTGSLVVSRVRGPGLAGSLPAPFGEVLEFRARAEIVAPERLDFVPRGDRRYAGILSLGLHTHFEVSGLEAAVGADLVMTGPQTGMDEVQAFIHRLLDYPEPRVAASQIPDGLYPTLVVELGRPVTLGPATKLRPFVEAQAGLETLVRAGLDLTLGRFGEGALMARDPVSGQRYRIVQGDRDAGLSLVVGGDVARVFDSRLLPEGGAAVLSETRTRLRGGLAWQGQRASVFYGLSWLGKEFETQRDSQIVGSLSLTLNF